MGRSREKARRSAAGARRDDEYEVKEILDIEGEDSAEPMYLIKLVGYDEPTLEPEENVPPALVAAFKRKRAQKTNRDQSSGRSLVSRLPDEESTPSIKCASCRGSLDVVTSRCERCKQPMHHFCAHDVCEALNLFDDAGMLIAEFPNDLCYCSVECYNNRNRPRRPAATKRRLIADDPDSNSDAVSDIEASGVASAKRRRTTTAKLDDDLVEYTETVDLSDTDDDDSVTTNAKGYGDNGSSTQAHLPSKPAAKANQKPKAGVSKPKPKPKSAAGKQRRKPKEAASKSSKKRRPKKQKNPPIEIVTEYLGRSVAFCAEPETWMPEKDYKIAKDLFLSGRVFKAKKTPKTNAQAVQDEKLYEVRWSYTHFQGKKYVHRVDEATIKRGIRYYDLISGGILSNASWRAMCSASPSDAWDSTKSLDEYVIWDGSTRNFETRQMLPETLEDIEQLKNLDFQATRRMKEPPDLFRMDDGSTKTRIRPECAERFARSASSSFLAYLPVSFWKKVVGESNAYAESERAAAITLNEMMTFLGILFYMTLVDKGEYSNYWGDQPEDQILGNARAGLEKVMSLKRFQFIRRVLCFRHGVTPDQLNQDPAARIRPLMNMLKHTSPRYVELGRDVAVDESSIACRSKFGRHLIVFNSSKPTGKFHFKIYACCCSTTWLMVGFRLHCSSDMKARLGGVVPTLSAKELESRLQYSSEIRKHVLEVTHPIHNSKRIVNTDNFYTSVALLMSLKEVGLYGRGTVRENSKHFPKAHMFGKKDVEARGTMMQGVSASSKIVAASWMDGNAVNIISNADASDQTEVRRLVGRTVQTFPAPRCIAEYNQHMQGVDRMDQLRAQFSLADGHSFQKWHKKLAMAFIDIARCNAYVT